jgi:hypothetical protein
MYIPNARSAWEYCIQNPRQWKYSLLSNLTGRQSSFIQSEHSQDIPGLVI